MKNSELISFGQVHLEIRDLKQSVNFWHDLVGLNRLDETDEYAALGIDGAPLIVLHRSATWPIQRGYSGLYHLAIHLPNEPELARVLARVRASGHRFGASDHIVAKSVYLNDPDGIGLEIAFETPERVRSYRWDRGAERPLVIDSDGRPRDGVEPLAIQDVLTKLPEGDILTPLPSGTTVGHLHLQVADLEASYRFYSDRIGLVPNLYAPWAGYGDLGAAGQVAHRIAVNTWQGPGVPPRPVGMAGMRSFTMRFESPERLRDAVEKIGNAESHDGGYFAHDPDGNTITML